MLTIVTQVSYILTYVANVGSITYLLARIHSLYVATQLVFCLYKISLTIVSHTYGMYYQAILINVHMLI